MDATLFDLAAERLEHHTALTRLEARGTLRIALKIAGLTAKSVTAGQLCVVFEKLMPDELEKRDVTDAAAACNAVMNDARTPRLSRTRLPQAISTRSSAGSPTAEEPGGVLIRQPFASPGVIFGAATRPTRAGQI